MMILPANVEVGMHVQYRRIPGGKEYGEAMVMRAGRSAVHIWVFDLPPSVASMTVHFSDVRRDPRCTYDGSWSRSRDWHAYRSYSGKRLERLRRKRLGRRRGTQRAQRRVK